MSATDKDVSFSDIDVANYVLSCEVEGLQALSKVLDDGFIATVDLLHRCEGRIIVSGMGKSGHVARKMAATFASTGTPAFFVHPGEASHGDLGMVTDQDVVLLLSNSGETAELKDFIYYCKRFSIPLVGVARRQGSALVDAATVALVLPETPEASPVGAPTTSTTMMMALGDVLAVALLERRGFSHEDFGVFHPGGKLGQAFLKVEDLMHTGDEIPLVLAGTLMSDVLLEMTAKRLGCTGVVTAEGVLLGIVTDGDLRRHMDAGLLEQPVDGVMTQGPVTVTASQLAVEALRIMEDKSITNLFVLEGDVPVGVIHIHDILRAGVA